MASYASNYNNLEECERDLNEYITRYEHRISQLQNENNRLSREHGEILERYVQLSEQLQGTNNPSDEDFEVLDTIEEEEVHLFLKIKEEELNKLLESLKDYKKKIKKIEK